MSAELALPKGALVLVTGANGYIASHVADQLMKAGYKVRGTTRSEEKAKGIAAIFEKRHGKGAFTYVIVPDASKPGAFDEPMKDCQAVAHVASDLSFSPDPNAVIPGVVDSVTGLLKAAKAHSTVKRVVLTSSSLAAFHPVVNKEFTVTDKNWNEEDVKSAWAPPPYEQQRSMAVYGASKVQGEQAAWEFMRTEKPDFVFNSVLPNLNVGEKLDPNSPGSTAGWIERMYKGDEGTTSLVQSFPPQFTIDVKDDALLHVAALIYKDVANERLLGFAEPFNYQTWLDVFKKIAPEKSFPPALNQDKDLSKPQTQRCVELLKRLGQNGWTPLETSIRELLSSCN